MTETSTVNRGGAPRVSLVAVLSAVLFAELWLNRIAARLARLDPSLAESFHRVDVLALFSFELASVLATVLLGWAVVRTIGRPGEKRTLRASVAIVGGTTLALAVGGVWLRLPIRLQVYLYTSALFLLLIVVLGTLAIPVSKRLRAGTALLAVPIGMMLVANLLQRFSPPGLLDPRASVLGDLSGAAFVLAGLLAPLLFPPARGRSPAAATVGALVLCTGLVLGRLDWSLTARIAGIGVGVAIPLGSWSLPVYVLGAAGFAYAITALVASDGADRLRGWGLFLVCLVGLQLELPYQLASTLLGFFCLMEAAVRVAPPAMTRPELDALLRRTAALVGAAQVTVVGAAGRESARLAFDVVGRPAQLVVERRASAISRVELSVGEIPERAPPLSLATRGSTSLGPAAPGPVLETDDAPFDRRFVVRDHRGASTTVLDTPMRARLLRTSDGLPDAWIGVWPQRGARFRGVALPPGDDGLSSLSQLLADLSQP